MALDLTRPATPPPPVIRGPRPSTGGSSKAAEKARGARLSEREEGLGGLIQLATLPLMATGNLADMGAVTAHGPNIAHEAAELAEHNEKVANAVDKIISVGPFAGLIAATIPLILQILVNHGRLPANMFGQFGVFPPEMMHQTAAIEIQKRAADLARMQAQAHADLRDAQEELAREQARMNANGSSPDGDE